MMNKIRLIAVALFLLGMIGNNKAQISPDHYLVNLTDKNNSKYSIDKPEEFLSERAIERRLKYNIQIVENDLPVNQNYLDSLKSLGLKIVNVSKWMNSVSVFSQDSVLIDTLDKLSFVRSVGIDKIKSNSLAIGYNNKTPLKNFGTQEMDSSYFLTYGNSFPQIQIHNGHLMHKEGYQGQGMHIAILDGGFYKVDELPAFDSLRANNQLLGTRDFVDGDLQVYDADNHGMKVLSTMAGNIPGQLVGTAPKASYWLLRSEQTATEYIIEEHNWVVAAEFADSAGVDIINSSLGYSDFDDNNTNHTYADMDGNTTLISRAADIVASKGILVVTSAGNEGISSWKYISAPADADSILSVGAIMKDGQRAYFSSYGPTVDQRIKPEVCAVGLPSVVSGTDGQVSVSTGTSFSSPIMAGLVACLWQAHPELNNMEIIDIIERSASQFSAPDTSLGYGIPDIYAAHIYLKSSGAIDMPSNGNIKVFPNPFKDEFHIEFLSQNVNIPYDMRIELFNMQGRKMVDEYLPNRKNNFSIQTLDQLRNIGDGLYVLRLTADNKVYESKVIKN